MKLSHTPLKFVFFPEIVATQPDKCKNLMLDIIIDGEINSENYCKALMEKLLKLQQIQYSSFIIYQLESIRSPSIWLDCFELFIAENQKLFKVNEALLKFNKLIVLIDKKRDVFQFVPAESRRTDKPKRLINAETEDRYFSFHDAKLHTDSLLNFNDKIIYLTEEIFEYKQADIISKNSKLLDYDFQCNQLIEKLQTLRKMKTEFEKEIAQSNICHNSNAKKREPLRINGAINILTNVFKQMMSGKQNGKPYLSYKIKDISEFICDNFLDENGQQLSPATVQTYLSPNRTDKDPNRDNMIVIQ